MISSRKRRIILAVIAFAMPALACSLVNPKTISPTPTPVSTAEMQAMATDVQAAVATAAQGGKVNLEFTAGQLTAAANDELQKQGENRIKDVQIGLDAGVLTLTGLVDQNGLELPMTISMQLPVDSQGKVHAQILSGKIGMFAIPEDMLNQITGQVDQMLASQLQDNGKSVFVESLTIANGKIDIVAQVQ